MAFDLKNLLKGFKDQLKNHAKASKIKDDDFELIWQKVAERIDNEPPPRIAIIGNTGVGKSSTLNALFNAGQPISHTEACTQIEGLIEIVAETIEGQKGFLDVYDMPGLDESVESQARHLATYERVLKDIDVAIWILEAPNRGIKNVQDTLINDLQRINPELTDRIVFALNKVDLVYPGETSWNPLANLPNDEQEINIARRIEDVEEKIKEILPNWKGRVIGYSADKRYNLTKLFSTLLDAVPETRRWVVSSRKALSDYLELVHDNYLPEEYKTIKRKNIEERNNSKGNKLIEGLKSLTLEERKQLFQEHPELFKS